MVNATARHVTKIVGICPINLPQKWWNIMLMEITNFKNEDKNGEMC
jgi:hypothetical protein